MGPDDVDFTVTPSDRGVDEDLPQPERRPWSPSRRAVAGGLGVLALVGIGMALLPTRPTKPIATPSRSVATTPSDPERFTVVPQPRITRFEPPPDVIVVDANQGAVACPQAGDGQSACQSTHAVAPGVVTALRAHFPGARVVAETDQTLRDTGFGSNGLWYRRVVATAGPIRITVMIRRPLPEDVTAGRTRVEKDRVVMTESTASGAFTVTASVDAPAAHPALAGALDLLISDQRLLVAR